ncbi:hypothetical protein OLL83_001068 [Shewanella algae]|uniref:hypothetical protein n=1 Tax=Shewanella algae TaxID=38313 RepID=UPI00222F75A8|nr:hypothetical protein [Shewanella algae]UZD59532.1 hypothetical protein OLL83_001068 [Shewanella algae]
MMKPELIQRCQNAAYSFGHKVVPVVWFRLCLGLSFNRSVDREPEQIDHDLVVALVDGGKALGELYQPRIAPTDDVKAKAMSICDDIEAVVRQWIDETGADKPSADKPNLYSCWLGWYNWRLSKWFSDDIELKPDWIYQRAVEREDVPGILFPGYAGSCSRAFNYRKLAN